MTITNLDALTRTIDHREIFHDEMLSLVRRIMSGEMSPVMMAALLAHLEARGVLATGLIGLRFVTHLDVDAAGVDRAIAAVSEFMAA